MPTVTEWQQALTRQYQLRIESSNQLCTEVQSVQQRRATEKRRAGKRPLRSKAPTPWPTSGQSQTITMRPMDMLHALGRITTPPITELVDLSSTWAEIRYLWAFVPNLDGRRIRSLRLNPSVKDLDFHQKTLLSDEFGVGFSAYFMTVCAGATDPVDAFVAKRGGQIRLRGNSRRSLPDYIYRGSQPNEFYIVECKGTQSARATAINQLQRGTEQVLTVDITETASITRLVIAAWLQQSITLLIVDPEEDSQEGGEVRKLSRWDPEEAYIFADAKRLTYVGDRSAAFELVRGRLDESHALSFGPRHLASRETPFGKFLGSTWLSEMPDGRVLRMFRGLDAGVYERIRQRVVLRPPDVQMKFSEGVASGFQLRSDGNERQAVVSSLAPDGSLFEVEIQ